LGKKILGIPDPHAKPGTHNKRADYLSNLIIDERPDIVVNMGDGADMESLASYDKGKRSFYGKSYKGDIDAHLDFQSRMWDKVRARKKKLPDRYFLIGNHEYRIERALDLSPELEGTIGYKDLDLDTYYNEVIDYTGQTPGIKIIEGIAFAHYFTSGLKGLPIGGEHAAYTLLSKNWKSSVQGHSHLLDYCIRTDTEGNKLHGLVCGVYQDYDAPWAGNINNLWWRGCVILDNAEDGQYDLRCISMKSLEAAYG
jgi:hypothetical protein